MSRCFFPALILLMVVVIIGLVWLEHRPQGITMPLVQAVAPDAESNRLFSPCPLSPKNIPPRQEVSA